MGYQNQALAVSPTYNFKCATFKAMGKSEKVMTFGDIKASNFEFGGDSIFEITEDGAEGVRLTYISDEGAAGLMIPGFTKGGWFDLAYVTQQYPDPEDQWMWDGPIPAKWDYTDRVLAFGSWVVVQTTGDSATIDFAGEVINENYQFDLVISPFYNRLGNATPVDITYGDIIMTGFEFGGDSMFALTTDGAEGVRLTYISDEDAVGLMIPGFTKGGWFDLAYVTQQYPDPEDQWQWDGPIPAKWDYTNRTVPSGMGFIVQTTGESATMEIPTPIPAAN